jgi:hypothetical protein
VTTRENEAFVLVHGASFCQSALHPACTSWSQTNIGLALHQKPISVHVLESFSRKTWSINVIEYAKLSCNHSWSARLHMKDRGKSLSMHKCTCIMTNMMQGTPGFIEVSYSMTLLPTCICYHIRKELVEIIPNQACTACPPWTRALAPTNR